MGKSIIKNILIMMIVVFLELPVYADVLGTTTTHGYFYLPAYGEFGEDAFDEYNLYMEKADNQIEASKEITDLITVPDATGKILETYEDEEDDYKIKFKYISTPVDTDTTYSAGTGMQLDGTTFNCTVTDTNTTYSAGTGMSLNGTTFNCSVVDTNTTYSAGTGMQLDGTTFNCTVTDTNTTYTAGDGLKLTGTEFSLDFKYNPSLSNQTYSGIPDTGTVGEAVAFGDLLYFKWSDKKYYKAKADSPATAEVVAMAVESNGAGYPCRIIRQGYIRNDSWSAFTDSIVYLSTSVAGGVQSSVPDSSGDQIKRVGQAVDSNVMFFNPSQDIGEVK